MHTTSSTMSFAALALVSICSTVAVEGTSWRENDFKVSDVEAITCAWTDPISGYSFDLSSLQARTYYRIHGVVTEGADSYHSYRGYYKGERSEGYDYVVNVCANVGEEPPDLGCDDTAIAAAYQVSTFDDTHESVNRTTGEHKKHCSSLGTTRASSWAIQNEDAPERGVLLTYAGGEGCHKRNEFKNDTGHTVVEWESVPRSITLNMTCAPDQGSEISDYVNMANEIRATEDEMCHYVVHWPSRAACPAPPASLLWKLVSLVFKIAGYLLVVFAALMLVNFSGTVAFVSTRGAELVALKRDAWLEFVLSTLPLRARAALGSRSNVSGFLSKPASHTA